MTLSSFLVAAALLGQVPTELGYQGRLLKSDGTPETGVVTLVFTLYDASAMGNVLWTESQQLALSDGYYATFLGRVTPIPGTVFDGSTRYLQLAVGAEVLSPRQRVASVPYALRSGVDFAQVQQRVTGTCGNGTFVIAVGVDGGVSCGAAASGVTSVTASAPLASTGGATPDLSLPLATASANGYLASGDWSTFNGKVSSVSAAASSGVLVGGSATAPTVSLLPCASGQVPKAQATAGTWACGSDNTGAAGVTAVSATAPLASSGGATPNLSMPAASAAANGYLASADWSAFNGKAPGAGSAAYLQNQVAASQNASFNISGTANIGGGLTVAGALQPPRYTLPTGWVLGDALGNDGMALFYAQKSGVETSVVALTVADNTTDSIFLGGSAQCCGGTNFLGLRVYADGTAQLSGSLTANAGTVWGDVAEFTEVDGDAEVGDVLAIDPETGHMRRSRTANDSAVAGVVSERPSVVLNRAIGKPVALVGNVRVKVSARYGAIRPGDLLTSSPLEGRAMKAARPAPGAIIGKALEPLARGEGTIRVWLTLR